MEQVATTTANTKLKLILVIILIALVIGVVIYFYFQGKKKGQDTTNLNLSSPLDPQGNAPGASEAEIRIMAQQLHDDMEGLNLWGHNDTLWDNFLAMNDNDVIRVNNRFNSEYQLESGESFVQWVSNESGDYPKTALVRLKKLNLS